MGIEISSMYSNYLKDIATKIDDGDGKLSGKEYKIFAQEAVKCGVKYEAIKLNLHMNALESWWFDVDKVSSDEADDGKLGLGEIAESVSKGFIGNLVKGIVNHPIATVVGVAAGFGLLLGTGGAAAPALVAAGTTLGGISIAANGVKAALAKTDTEAKEAWEGVGTGLFAVATSAAGAKSALNCAAKGGVESAFGGKYMNPLEALVQCFKATPDALKSSYTNLTNNINSLAVAAGIAKNTTITPEMLDKHVANSLEYGFEIKPEQEAYFQEQMNAIAKDSWGGEHAVRDMRKVMAGLEKLNFEGKMTPSGYRNMAKTIDADLPGCYWSAAIRLYNKCAKLATPAQTNAIVSDYLQGVTSINGMSDTFRLSSKGSQYLPLAGILDIANN